jgi:hypothetical protein
VLAGSLQPLAMGKGRTEAFSDDVLAVVITLLVLNLSVASGIPPQDCLQVATGPPGGDPERCERLLLAGACPVC